METQKWCCDTLRSWSMEKGQRGFSIEMEQTIRLPLVFTLVHRAVDEGMEGSVVSTTPLNLESRLCLRFCPFCGKQLIRDLSAEDFEAGGAYADPKNLL